MEIPSAGGGTSVASMRAAYAALPEDERRRLASLKTFNSLDRDHTDTRPEDQDKYGTPIEHPMIRTHPETGEPALYAGGFAVAIKGFSSAESDPLQQLVAFRA